MGAQMEAMEFTASPSPVWSSRTAIRRFRAVSGIASAKRYPSTVVRGSGVPICGCNCWRYHFWSLCTNNSPLSCSGTDSGLCVPMTQTGPKLLVLLFVPVYNDDDSERPSVAGGTTSGPCTEIGVRHDGKGYRRGQAGDVGSKRVGIT